MKNDLSSSYYKTLALSRFIDSHYEVEGTTIRKYYLAGTTRVAMRTGTDAPVYFLQDHLGSTSITTDSSGDWEAEVMYKAWGEVRSVDGTTPTNYTYTGQYSNTADFGLMYYGARWYDPALGRFAQADIFIQNPGNPKAYDRYSYILNNPINGIDPSGHFSESQLIEWYGENWKTLFNDIWQNILLTAELGDALAFSWVNGSPNFAIFVLQDNQLVGWDLQSKTAQSFLNIKNKSQDDKLALYRSKNANKGGGSTQYSTNIYLEENDPTQAGFNGSNHYIYIAGWARGEPFYDLPSDWYIGKDSYIRAYKHLAGFAKPSWSTVITFGFGGYLIYKGATVFEAFTPVGIITLAIDLGSLTLWDTNYEVLPGNPWVPKPVPTPPQ